MGAVAGILATYAMEKFSAFVYGHQSAGTRKAEDELRKEMPTAVLARKVWATAGWRLERQQAEKAGTAIHWAFGALWGPVTAISSREWDWNPVASGSPSGFSCGCSSTRA